MGVVAFVGRDIEFEAVSSCKVSFEGIIGSSICVVLLTDCNGGVTLFSVLFVVSVLVAFIVSAYTIFKKPGETEIGVTTVDEIRITIKQNETIFRVLKNWNFSSSDLKRI